MSRTLHIEEAAQVRDSLEVVEVFDDSEELRAAVARHPAAWKGVGHLGAQELRPPYLAKDFEPPVEAADPS
jgi:hypothetical protein